jgi:hypothetical protein
MNVQKTKSALTAPVIAGVSGTCVSFYNCIIAYSFLFVNRFLEQISNLQSRIVNCLTAK